MIRQLIAILVAWLALAGMAGAQVPTLPLASPPTGSNVAASRIFDALIAISHAASINPQAAQTASFSYAAAIQQYNIGDFDRSQQSAEQALMQAAAPKPPLPPGTTVSAPPPLTMLMPAIESDRSADRDAVLALGRRALIACGPTDGPTFLAQRSVYDTAVKSYLARRSADLDAEVTSIISACSVEEGSPAATQG